MFYLFTTTPQCSHSCGGGVKRRMVECLGQCPIDEQPLQELPCNLKSCLYYRRKKLLKYRSIRHVKHSNNNVENKLINAKDQIKKSDGNYNSKESSIYGDETKFSSDNGGEKDVSFKIKVGGNKEKERIGSEDGGDYMYHNDDGNVGRHGEDENVRNNNINKNNINNNTNEKHNNKNQTNENHKINLHTNNYENPNKNDNRGRNYDGNIGVDKSDKILHSAYLTGSREPSNTY